MSRSAKGPSARGRSGAAPGPLARELGRWLPLASLGGAILLSWSSLWGFVQGSSGALGTLTHLVLGTAVCFSAGRLLVAVVGHYERRAERPPSGERTGS